MAMGGPMTCLRFSTFRKGVKEEKGGDPAHERSTSTEMIGGKNSKDEVQGEPK